MNIKVGTRVILLVAAVKAAVELKYVVVSLLVIFQYPILTKAAFATRKFTFKFFLVLRGLMSCQVV